MPLIASNSPEPRAATSSGQPEFIEPLARAATAVGIAGIFIEVHNDPAKALSDGANALRAQLLPDFWKRLTTLDKIVKSWS